MKRALSLSAIVSIIFFNVSGGTFALEEVLGAGPGLALLLLLVMPLIWSAPVALVCAELGTAIPEEGGYYAWSKRALGPFGAFCQGWWAWLYTFIDIGLYPTMFCEYLGFLAPEFAEGGSYWLRKGLMIVMIWSFVLLNLFGSRTIGGISKLFFVLVMSPFVILVLVGLYRGLTGGFPLNPVLPMLAPGKTLGPALAVAIPVVLWNYMGWDSVSTIAGEMENPQRTYPRALLISVLLIAMVYVVPAVVALALVGTEQFEWKTGAWSLAAQSIGGPTLATLTSAMGMVSAIGIYSALVLVYSRVPFVMGRDGYLPKALMKTNRWNAPWVSLIVSGFVYTVVILMFQNVEELASAAVTVSGGMLSLELLSFLVLRWREPNLARPFRVPGGWVVAVVLCVLPLLCVGSGAYFRVQVEGLWNAIGLAIVVMASGPLLYPLCKR
ncbi:MAG: APC family permease [Planctomycetaceae bacterium]